MAQKQLLVDTILRDYDVPKLYWRKIGSKPDKYDGFYPDFPDTSIKPIMPEEVSDGEVQNLQQGI
jgi:hypothetical protein